MQGYVTSMMSHWLTLFCNPWSSWERLPPPSNHLGLLPCTSSYQNSTRSRLQTFTLSGSAGRVRWSARCSSLLCLNQTSTVCLCVFPLELSLRRPSGRPPMSSQIICYIETVFFHHCARVQDSVKVCCEKLYKSVWKKKKMKFII